MSLEMYEDVLRWAKELVLAEKGSLKACDAMRNAPLGISRARSTTLNAKWSTAAEHRDRILHKVHVAVVRAGIAGKFDDDYYVTHATGHKWNQILIEREKP